MASLPQDIATLSEVSKYFPKNIDMSIVAYCDGPACTSEITNLKSPVPFRVLSHAEVIASQALASADSRGECIVADSASRSAKVVAWRKPNSKAMELAAEMAK